MSKRCTRSCLCSEAGGSDPLFDALAEIERLREVLAEIAKQYSNQDLIHVVFRVAAKMTADAALPSPRGQAVSEIDERDAFEEWAHSDNRCLEPQEFEERAPDNNHYYRHESDNQAYIGWCARAALASPKGEGAA